MGESFRDLPCRIPNQRFTEELLKVGLMQVFLHLTISIQNASLSILERYYMDFQNLQLLIHILITH